MFEDIVAQRWKQGCLAGGGLTVVGSVLPWTTATVRESASVGCVSIWGETQILGVATAGGFGTFLLGLLLVGLVVFGNRERPDGTPAVVGAAVCLVAAHSAALPEQHQLIGAAVGDPVTYASGIGLYAVVVGGIVSIAAGLHGYPADRPAPGRD